MTQVMDRITSRESEVLKMAADGHSNVAISDHLGVSVETVKSHFRTISRKTGARNRSHAVAIALRNGWIG
jgi:DNA-binding CsgD family transcriptional regulator